MQMIQTQRTVPSPKLCAVCVFCLTCAEWMGTSCVKRTSGALCTMQIILLMHYTALANRSAQLAEWRWNVVPKMHMLWHWSRQCQYIHPRDTGTYMDEDFVGIIKEICRACTGGMAIPRLPGTVMRKYAQGCLLRWHKRACEAV